MVGPSPYSFTGNGAILLNGPLEPQNFAEDRSKTTAYTIGMTWTAPLDNGGAPILDYAIQYD